MLERRLERSEDQIDLTPVIDRGELLAMQRAVEALHAVHSERCTPPSRATLLWPSRTLAAS